MPNRLPNTQFPQSSRNVFPPQSSTANGQQPRGGVWQDKGASRRASVATPQPAPLPKVMRPHEMNSNTFRSQNRPTPKRKTVHLTLWVKPIVKAELQRRAAQDGVSVSATGAAFLERALQASVDMQYGALIEPIIEQAIAKHMRAYSNRLAVLLVRSLFASEQVRGLVTNILSRQDGVTQPDLEEILNGSSNAAKRNITRLTPQLAALVEEIKRWMDEEVKPND